MRKYFCNISPRDPLTLHPGDDVMFAPNVQLYTATHPTGKRHHNYNTLIVIERTNCLSSDPDLRCYPNLWELAKPIKVNAYPYYFLSNVKSQIGNRVWLGGGVIVLPGVTIGDNTTIGAGSVVTKDIPANCVAVGNPCKVVKHLPVKEQQK